MRHSLLTSLEVTKRQVKLVSLAAVAAGWLAATFLLLLGFVIWDHWDSGGVPGWAATGLRVLYLAGTLVWLSAGVVLPLVRSISDLYAARLIEREHPEFGNVLVGAVQLARREELPGSVRVAIVDQAARQVGQTDVRRSVPRGMLRLSLLLLLAAAVFFIGYSVLAPKSVLVSVRRALGWQLAPPTRTLITAIEPADGLRVLRGQDVRFRVTLAGEAPARATIRFSTDGGQTWPEAQQLPLFQPARGEVWLATRAGADVQVSMSWQVVAGDALSEVRQLIVLPQPAIVDTQVRYEYPRYTGLPPTTQPGGEIDALVGTRAIVEARANVPVFAPVLVVGEGVREQRRVPSQGGSAASSHQISVELLVLEDDSYELQFRDEQGHPSVPVRHRIHARPDQIPLADWKDGAERIEIATSDRFLLEGRAQDDFGLTRVALMWRKAGDAAARELPMQVRRNPDGSYEVSQELTAVDLALAAGDRAEVWITVWDNREDPGGAAAYQRAESAVRQLIVHAAPAGAPVLADRSTDDPERAPGRATQTDDAMRDNEPHALAAREERGRRFLQEIENERDKELALLENELAREMQGQSGRVQSSLPEVVPQPGATQGPLPTEEQGPGDAPDGTAEPMPANEGPAPVEAGANPERASQEPAAEGEQRSDAPPDQVPHAAAQEGAEGREGMQAAAGENTGGTQDADARDSSGDDGEGGEGEAGRGQADHEGGDRRGEHSRDGMNAQDGQRTSEAPDEVRTGQSPPERSSPESSREGSVQAPQGETGQSGSDQAQEPGQAGEQSEASGESPQNQSADAGMPGHQPVEREASPGDASESDSGLAPDSSTGQAQQPGHSQQPGQGEQDQQSPPGEQAQQPGQGDAAGQDAGERQGKGTSEAEPPREASASGEAGDQPPEQLGEVGPGSPISGTGGRAGGVSHGLPDAAAPPQDVAPPSTSESRSPALGSQGRRDKLAEALDRQLRAGAVDPALLAGLGWDLPRARQFVEEYKREKATGQRQQDRTPLPDLSQSTTRRAAEADVLQGGASADPGRAFRSSREISTDELPDVIDPSRQRVPARYRWLLEAYYRTITSQPAQ